MGSHWRQNAGVGREGKEAKVQGNRVKATVAISHHIVAGEEVK
jgi:hypothetical protein